MKTFYPKNFANNIIARNKFISEDGKLNKDLDDNFLMN
jgi:hypothetical protein